MRFGGIAHANCADGYEPVRHDPIALDFAAKLRTT